MALAVLSPVGADSGPSITDWLALIVAVASIAIAGWALKYSRDSREAARIANDHSADANLLAVEANTYSKQSAEISQAQYDVAMEEQSRRAVFDIKLDLVREEIERDPRVIRIDQNGVRLRFGALKPEAIIEVRVMITITNRGTKAAGSTVLDFLFPAGLLDVRSSGRDGENLEGRVAARSPAGDTIGPGISAERLRWSLDGLLKSANETVYATLGVPVHDRQHFYKSGRVVMPVAVVAQAAEARRPARRDFSIRMYHSLQDA